MDKLDVSFVFRQSDQWRDQPNNEGGGERGILTEAAKFQRVHVEVLNSEDVCQYS